LRSFKDLDKIYLLIRESPDRPASLRLEKEILSSDLFDPLRSSSPAMFEKVVPVPGDISLPNFGITSEKEGEEGEEEGGEEEEKEKEKEEEEERERKQRKGEEIIREMREKVSVIFHCAATVNFNEQLKISLNTNVSSVQRLLSFSRTLARLDAMIHVSTAFSHCDLQHIEERYYPPVVDPLLFVDTIKTMSEGLSSSITKPLLGRRPNTYTLTKALAEEVIRRESTGLPVAVVRPSIVTGIDRDPIPGWTDSLNGPGGLYMAVAYHLLKVMPGDEMNVFDIIPVDYCINMMIAVAWKIGTSLPPPQSPPPIYNCNSGTLNPVIWRDHNVFTMKGAEIDPVKKPTLLQWPSFTFYRNRNVFYFFDFFQHRIPAAIYDFFRKLRGKRPLMEKIWRRIYSTINAYTFFIDGTWTWENSNSLALLGEMYPRDKELFDFDVRHINWQRYLPSYYMGCKRLALAKEKEREVRIAQEAAKAKEKEKTGSHTGLAFFSTSTVFASSTLILVVGASLFVLKPDLFRFGGNSFRFFASDLDVSPPSLGKE